MVDDWKAKLAAVLEQIQASAPVAGRQQTNGFPNDATRTASAGGAVNAVDGNSNNRSHAQDGSTPTNNITPKSSPRIDAILGVDFGTRYTKVALSLPHIDRREILSFGSLGRLLPSRVIIDSVGQIAAIQPRPNATTVKSIEYLKMRLANPDTEAFGSSTPLGSYSFSEAVRALSAYYLAIVLRVSTSAARRTFPQELSTTRPINWSANIGVPVKHCDGDALWVFSEVVRVAWEWAWGVPPPHPPTTDDLVDHYTTTAAGIGNREMPVSVVPELAAALVHFAEQRNTPAGLYAFIDIGGGTVDGAVFRLTRELEGSRFVILSADVDEIGTMAVARHLVANAYLEMSELVEKPIIFDGPTPAPRLPIPKSLEQRVQTVFAKIVGEARRKLPGQNFENFSDTITKSKPGLNPPSLPIIPLYIAGGGCTSEWYRHLFARIHQEFNHSSWGIGGYKIETVPRPPNVLDDEYPRFVVALGLTSQTLHFDKYKLPSRVGQAAPLTPRPPPVTPYEHTKEIT